MLLFVNPSRWWTVRWRRDNALVFGDDGEKAVESEDGVHLTTRSREACPLGRKMILVSYETLINVRALVTIKSTRYPFTILTSLFSLLLITKKGFFG
jgi:hypothetical protein